MNKDVKGLLIYLLILLIVCLMPTGMVYFVFGVMFYDNSKLSHLCLMITISFFILYFLIPITITHYAIKKHWSIYLDWFFNQWLSPSLILITLLLLPITLKVDDVAKVSWNFSVFLYDFYFGAIPCYCLIYIVIFWHNLWRLVRKIVKFIHEKL